MPFNKMLKAVHIANLKKITERGLTFFSQPQPAFPFYLKAQEIRNLELGIWGLFFGLWALDFFDFFPFEF